MAIPFGGHRVAVVSDALAEAFRPGDRLIVIDRTGDLLRLPAATYATVQQAVGCAHAAFQRMGEVSDDQVSRFFEAFAARLEDEAAWSVIAAANALDVANARSRGRSTTRLVADGAMRRGMIAGLRAWRDASPARGQVVETVRHEGW